MPPKSGGPLVGLDDRFEKVLGEPVDCERHANPGAVDIDHRGLDHALVIPEPKFQTDAVSGNKDLVDFQPGTFGAQVMEVAGKPLGRVVVEPGDLDFAAGAVPAFERCGQTDPPGRSL